MKRKSAVSASIESGATSPTRRLKAADADETAKTIETMLTLEEWAELHEFAGWLETLEATQIRKTLTQTDRQMIEKLMVQPPTRATRSVAWRSVA